VDTLGRNDNIYYLYRYYYTRNQIKRASAFWAVHKLSQYIKYGLMMKNIVLYIHDYSAKIPKFKHKDFNRPWNFYSGDFMDFRVLEI